MGAGPSVVEEVIAFCVSANSSEFPEISLITTLSVSPEVALVKHHLVSKRKHITSGVKYINDKDREENKRQNLSEFGFQ